MLKIWTIEKVLDAAKPYLTRVEFKRGDNKAYTAAQKNGWLQEACAHMTPVYRTLTKHDIATIASNFSSRSDFQKADGSAYATASNNNWLDEICSHMKYRSPGPYRWTKHVVSEIAKGYTSRVAFQKESNGAYSAAHRGKYLDEICSHMTRPEGGGGFDLTNSGYLYQIKFTLEDGTKVWKIGITNGEIQSRINEFRLSKEISYDITHTVHYEIGADARAEEKRLHTLGKKNGFHYKGKRFLRKGNTELFYSPLM